MSEDIRADLKTIWPRYAERWSGVLKDWLDASNKSEFYRKGPEEALSRMLNFWPAQASPAQTPPSNEPWKTWLFLGGRGAGKTHAGAGWLNGQAVKGARLALVGATLNDVREVMIEGPSGLRTIADDEDRPTYQSSRRRLVWPCGAVAHAFSAEEPERLRGPQFHAAWCDEFCAWPRAGETLALLRLGLRRGSDPRLVVTTTPRPGAALRRLMAEPGVVTTRARTADNAANLAPDFLASLEALYGGTQLAAQELDGQVVEADRNPLWRAADLARIRCAAPDRFERIVVAVDPPITSTGDACGIVVVGRADGLAYVLEDGSLKGAAPLVWARRACDLARRWKADKVVAEANQGGEMVRTMLAMAECPAPIALVHARIGKRGRAEPVAALYDQGKVRHAGSFTLLEEEMLALGSETPDLGHSPDRADALVWAITELLVEKRPEPRVRGL